MSGNLRDALTIRILHGCGALYTDPNHFAMMAAIPSVMFQLMPQQTYGLSDVSGEHANVVTYQDSEVTLHLTVRELMDLAGLRLKPAQYKRLVAKFGIKHAWHEDFYDPESGEAFQPRDALPTLVETPT